MTQTISTIVDVKACDNYKLRLYDPNNFYYCRYCLLRVATMLRLYDPNNFYYCR